MYQTYYQSRFRKDIKRFKHQTKKLEGFKETVRLLCKGENLPDKYRDHPLIGDYKGCRECHIEPDFLLIYRINEDEKIIDLVRIGSHSDLFK